MTEAPGLWFLSTRNLAQLEDNIEQALDQLHSEHALDGDVAEFIVSDLAVIANGAALPNPIHLAINLRNFAESHRRHVAWENAVVLPLAHPRQIRFQQVNARKAARLRPSKVRILSLPFDADLSNIPIRIGAGCPDRRDERMAHQETRRNMCRAFLNWVFPSCVAEAYSG